MAKDEMLEVREDILDEIYAERDRQLEVVGWSAEFDSKNTINDWVTYVVIYLGKAAEWHTAGRPSMGKTRDQARTNLIKVAALAVAALEVIDREKGPAARHYDTDVLPEEREATWVPCTAADPDAKRSGPSTCMLQAQKQIDGEIYKLQEEIALHRLGINERGRLDESERTSIVDNAVEKIAELDRERKALQVWSQSPY